MLTATLTRETDQEQTSADYQPVAALLDEIRHRQRLAESVTKWVGAFMTFKSVLRRCGLSDDEGEKRAFLKIVSELISMGRGLLAQMGEDTPDILSQAAISLDDFNACLEFLELQERTALWKPDAQTRAKLKDILGEYDSGT